MFLNIIIHFNSLSKICSPFGEIVESESFQSPHLAKEFWFGKVDFLEMESATKAKNALDGNKNFGEKPLMCSFYDKKRTLNQKKANPKPSFNNSSRSGQRRPKYVEKHQNEASSSEDETN